MKNKYVSALETGALKAVSGIFRIVPHKTALKMGSGIALFFHDVVGIRKEHAARELLKSFPDKDEQWAKETTRGIYRHFGKVMAELSRIPLMINGNFDDGVEIDADSVKILDDTMAKGKGAFIVSGHFGNWETAGALAADLGYPVDFLVGRQSNSGVEELLDRYRKSAGLGIIKAADAGKGILRSLRKNRMIAVMMDQDARHHGVFVPFFGRLASTPRGVGRFAVKVKPSIIFMHTYREKNDKICIKLHSIDYDYCGDNEKDIYELTKLITEKIEECVRLHPDQWLWLHKRWKTAPPVQEKM